MTSFQNPMGATMPEAKKQELVELLRRHQVPLIEDDVYAELYYGQQAPKPAKAFDTEGLVMHCGSFARAWPRLSHRLGRRRTLRAENRTAETDDFVVCFDARASGDRRLPATRRL